MNEIALHIEFLLHTHDCVIVPNLGGFIVNVSNVERNGLWGVDAPRCELVFNNKLTYNDGLLAESLMRTSSISFEAANDKIVAACEELKSKLSKGEQVICNSLGVFKGLTEVNEKNRPVFFPNKYYIRPLFYGLTNARLKPTALLTSKNTYDKNAIPLKPFIQYISSGIAMVLLLFFIVVSYNNYESKSQHAEMVSNPLIFAKKTSKITENIVVASIDSSQNNISVEAKLNQSSLPTNTSIIESVSHTNYYIIVGVYEVRDVAEKTLSILKKQGFMNASILNRVNRLDVYSESFDNQIEAQSFLKKFQVENPKYHDAWLLKR